ncbi:MAG: hypothetical protein ABR608_12065 [Pseudonocardiaceae bacterium]
MATLTDDFTTQDTAKWTFGSGASVTDGQLVMQCLSSYSSEANSIDFYDLTGSYFLLEVVSPQSAGTGTTVTYMICQNSTYTDKVGWEIGGSELRAQYKVANTNTTVWFDGFALADHRWLRTREDSGTVYWDTSPDAVTWTNRATWAPTISIASLRVTLGSGYYGTESSPASAVIDNFNLVPVPVEPDPPMHLRRVAPARR